jgi:hypothetical protein
MKYLEELRQMMAINNPVIEYQGVINQEIILKTLSELEKLMDSFGEKLKITRKAFTIITECLQNIVRYADKTDSPDKHPIFIFARQENQYIIASGNLVSNEKAQKLQNRLHELNQMDWMGIQEAYRDVIRKNMKEKDPERDRNSAGLGFIEMARKSEQKFVFKTFESEAGFQYFLLGITILKD